MAVRTLGITALCMAVALAVMPSLVSAEIYVRIHGDGRKEFTNRPSGHGWIFYMTEAGERPVIRFEKRAGKPKSLDEIITEIAYKFAIEASLVKAIIRAESNCNPNAVSSKGAQGLMQLMPGTSAGTQCDSSVRPQRKYHRWGQIYQGPVGFLRRPAPGVGSVQRRTG